jgi:hypothetical protein
MVWHVDKYKITFKLVISHRTNEMSSSTHSRILFSSEYIHYKIFIREKMLRKLKWQILGKLLAARYNWCRGPVPGCGPAVEKPCARRCIRSKRRFYLYDSTAVWIYRYKSSVNGNKRNSVLWQIVTQVMKFVTVHNKCFEKSHRRPQSTWQPLWEDGAVFVLCWALRVFMLAPASKIRTSNSSRLHLPFVNVLLDIQARKEKS